MSHAEQPYLEERVVDGERDAGHPHALRREDVELVALVDGDGLRGDELRARGSGGEHGGGGDGEDGDDKVAEAMGAVGRLLRS